MPLDVRSPGFLISVVLLISALADGKKFLGINDNPDRSVN
jgi:hypothetical protein